MVGGGGSDGISSSLVASTTGPPVENITISWQVLDTKSSMVMVVRAVSGSLVGGGCGVFIDGGGGVIWCRLGGDVSLVLLLHLLHGGIVLLALDCRCSQHLRWFRVSLKLQFSYRFMTGLWLRAKSDLMEGAELLKFDEKVPDDISSELLKSLVI
jgi:hypothetical protein